METVIKNQYYVAEVGRTIHGSKPIYANISYGDAYGIDVASSWEEMEFLIEDMKKFKSDSTYIVRCVEDTTVRVIKGVISNDKHS